MANKSSKLLINSYEFPFLSTQAPRASLENTDAAPRMPSTFYGDKANADFGIPYLKYCENVLPYAKGLFAISYTQQVAAISPATTICDQAIPIRDSHENVFTFVPADGANYVYNAGAGTWASVDPFTFSGNLVTVAYVNGRTFICYEQDRIIEYDSSLHVFNTVSITFPVGTAITDIRGIGGASNYLIMYTDINILWGSPLDILDFSNIDAGAGQSTPIDIKGQIVACRDISGGFILYTTRNAVGATYTYDANRPFIFKEIVACGGVATVENVTTDANDIGQYIWGTHGLQLVNLTGAVAVFPEVTDFLVGKQTEVWNATTKRIELTESGGVLAVKIAFLAGRYLVISYGQGITSYTMALVYDESLKRWGKLKIDHTDAFMYPYPSGGGVLTYDILPGNYEDLLTDYATLGIFSLYVVPAKQGIAFLKTTGQIMVLESAFTQTSTEGVAVFGPIALRNDRMLTAHTLEIDGLKTADTPVVSLLGSLDGLDRDSTTTMTTDRVAGNYSRYRCRKTARNFDLAIEGTFVLSTLLFEAIENGSR